MADACEIFSHASLPINNATCATFAADQIGPRPWTASYLPVFRYAATVDFIQHPGFRLVLLSLAFYAEISVVV